MSAKPQSVLFVCMGNICRSPTAEAVFRFHAQQAGIRLDIDSAGTLGSHAGERPDVRAKRAGEKRGYDFSRLRARKVAADDFHRFDLILAMDQDNYRNLLAISPDEALNHKVRLFLDYAPNSHYREVPDPYYGGGKGFELVLDLIEAASQGLIETIQ